MSTLVVNIITIGANTKNHDLKYIQNVQICICTRKNYTHVEGSVGTHKVGNLTSLGQHGIVEGTMKTVLLMSEVHAHIHVKVHSNRRCYENQPFLCTNSILAFD